MNDEDGMNQSTFPYLFMLVVLVALDVGRERSKHH